MAERFCRRLSGGVTVHGQFTDRSDGDLAADGPPAELRARRSALAPTPWTWLRQEHGSQVVIVDSPGAGAGSQADASVTDVPGATLSVQVADCAPVLLYAPGPRGAIVAAVHAGWRGLVAGVLPATAEVMREIGAGEISWILGPCISADAYEFSAEDLDAVVGTLGDHVRSHTAQGRPALDVRAAVAASLSAAAIAVDGPDSPPACTATSGRHWSYRARADRARQAAVIWWEASPASATVRGDRG